jgi:hypothetical protein
MAKREFKEKYNLTEDEMQDLINRSKEGDGAAQAELVEVFGNFLSKYVTLLFTGKFSTADYDIRRFIGLFVKDARLRYPLLRNKMNLMQMRQVNEAVRGIVYMTQRYCDEEDVEQTVRMAFLHCVSVYQRKEGIPFSGYLYSYFFYVLKKMVDTFLIDQLGRKTFPLLDDESSHDAEGEGEDRPVGFTAPPEPGVDEILGSEEIDEYWVSGESASYPFNTLTIQERQLLKWRYVDRERSSEIANRITEHPNTVREHFNRIREHLVEELRADAELW